MSKRFTRRIEDFTCEHCAAQVRGTGYTNHCPHCLYSKHVDVMPGDRAETCEGLLEPRGLDLKRGEYVIIHVCEACGAVRRNKTVPSDSRATLRAIATQNAV